MKFLHGRSGQHGAATLVAVMVMLLVVAMLAAYAGRNLVFEQRVAANHVRSASAREAAEAGLEWGLAQLNGGSIDTSCQPADKGESFRDRYLHMDAQGAIAPRTPPQMSSVVVANCLRDSAGGWQCRCPAVGKLDDLAGERGVEARPSFDLQFETVARTGVVRLLARGCSDSALSICHNFSQQQEASARMLGASLARIQAALLPALKTPPAAPLTVGQALSAGTQGVGLHNSEPGTGGLLLVSGQAVPTLPADRLSSLPGAQPEKGLVGNDKALSALLAGGRLFVQIFGMPASAYEHQPALQRMACAAGCAGAIAAAHARGVRMVWIEGDLQLSGPLEIGSAEAPLVIVTNGNARLSGGLLLHGLLFAGGNLEWSNPGSLPARVHGAAIVAGQASISGQVDFWYQREVLDRLSRMTGSFVRVPASYSDVNR